MKKLLLLFLVPLLMCSKETEEVEQKIIEEMALPTTNLSVSQVAATLGHPVSYNIGALCTHPNINKWSKWKPVRFPKAGSLTEEELKSVNCGMLVYPETENYKLLMPSSIMWFHNKPRGGMDEPFRIGDFRNYNKDGVPPISSLPANLITVNRITSPNLNMELGIVTYATMPMDDGTMFRIEDVFSSIGDKYYSIVFEFLGRPYIKTAYSPISEYGRSVSFNFANEYPLSMMSPGVDRYVFYSLLSNTRALTPTLLDDISPSVLFSPLPVSDTADNISRIMLISSSGLGFTPRKVSAYSLSSFGPFIDIPYYPPSAPLVSSTGVVFLVEVSNQTGNAITFPISGWEINANPTFWGANSSYFTCNVVNADTGTILLSSPVINPGETLTVGFSVANLLNRNGTAIQVVSTKETITTSIRFRNGIYEGNTSLHVTSN